MDAQAWSNLIGSAILPLGKGEPYSDTKQEIQNGQ